MYWPIGAPKVYAISKHATSHEVNRSNDGLGNGAESSEPSTSSSTGDREASIEDEGESGNTGGSQKEPDGTPAIQQEDLVPRESEIVDAKVSRGGTIFATITRSGITIWQTKPTVALASVVRSSRSMKAYDALVVVIQTSEGYLITYSLATDPNARVYATQLPASSNRYGRKDSVDAYSSYRRAALAVADAGPGEGDGIKEVNLRFRMVIRIDAGISKALALDDQLVVATQKPAAMQCIQWVSHNTRAQTSTELLSKMPWIAEKCTVVDFVHDRPMNLSCWITSDGRAYAVQRRSAANVDMDDPASLFQGLCFRDPETEDTVAIKAAINARFSLIAVGCANGQIDVYIVKDYMGNIPLSHKARLSVSPSTSGKLTVLSYSPDGYCLFAGYEKGWAMWSVYGKPGATSFGTDRSVSELNDEEWLHGVRNGFWTGGGCELILTGLHDDRIWTLEMFRNALTGCFSPASISRGLLQSSNSIILYKGHDIIDLTSLPSDMALWQTIQVPASYLLHHWPIKLAVVSADAKYIAVAGRRGLAHYSTISGRWRTFDDPQAEHEFSVRGGMCWFQHFLIACVEAGGRHLIRVYSREKALNYSHIQFSQELSSAAIVVTLSGTDSLLVYTYDNTLMHYIVVPTSASIKLVQVGQIGFHGIIRAPPRVRAISWLLPEDQMEHGDPSQDVATASVLFLVDGKLVLLQPSTNEHGELKYDMRVIAQNVEYYILLREQPNTLPASKSEEAASQLPLDNHLGHSLRDSLWYFDGTSFHVWSDIQDVLACAPADLGRDLPPTVHIPIDFYPISAMVCKGIINGLDPDLVQRRDVNFSFFRQTTRTELFLPQLLRYHLAEYNSPAALHLSQSYQHLPYFSHALEILLHDILDDEVDNPPSPPETALLPTAIAFLSSFPSFLDIVVNCTRKTELRSWRTLFSHLPPVLELFELSLEQGKLKTAAGYLLVLHTFDDSEQKAFEVREFARLLRRAAGEQEWELGRELARFLVGIDGSGGTLRAALGEARLGKADEGGGLDGRLVNGGSVSAGEGPVTAHTNGAPVLRPAMDYFSLRRPSGGEDGKGDETPGS
ncbi:WD40 repeat protein [Vermiconidia calcicola]|uniref:WD40 repeat protein n=1 Tax=Vermiconidia calcicola TaxID=1690605 RepID=A0ACC3NHH6_9PEZI|nr:WD40 repeat protein [Vermiconidia calcicola]